MSLKIQPTLVEMVDEVLADLNLGVQGEANADLHPLIKRKLRQAQQFLYNKYEWLQNRTTFTIALVTDVADYDLPDSFEAGQINQVYARSNTSGAAVVEWALQEGVTPDDRTLDNGISASTFNPYRYQIIDGIIRIQPMSRNSTPPTLYIEMQQAIAPLVNDDERPAVDGEACIQLASILVKEQRRMPIGDRERQVHAEHIANLEPAQGESRMTTIGTDYIHPCEIARRRDRRPYPNRDFWTP